MPQPDPRREFEIEVSCYSGFRYGERPITFKLLERTFTIKEILDQWYGPDYLYFKVRADDRKIYLMKYDQGKDQWYLTGLLP